VNEGNAFDAGGRFLELACVEHIVFYLKAGMDELRDAVLKNVFGLVEYLVLD
jgi:hypothetical protein